MYQLYYVGRGIKILNNIATNDFKIDHLINIRTFNTELEASNFINQERFEPVFGFIKMYNKIFDEKTMARCIGKYISYIIEHGE